MEALETPKTAQPNVIHHPIFHKFPCWRGTVPEGYAANFLGVFTKISFYSGLKNEPQGNVVTSYPPYRNNVESEDYFEWIDLLEAVIVAERTFTMIELGAGYGRWIVNAAAAVRQHSGIPYELIAVEAEPTHFRWITEHLQTNHVDLNSVQLYEAAVNNVDGVVGFYVQDHPYGGPADWYGQAIGGTTPVKAIRLTNLLIPLAMVDLIDVDIQGAELSVLQAAEEQLNSKVKRIHVRTHNPDVENGLRTLFSRLGWVKLRDYSCGRINKTEYGDIDFQDGVQSWINPKLFAPDIVAAMNAKHIPTILGFGLQLDPNDRIAQSIEREGAFEIPETDLITRLVRSGDMCINVGSRIGYYTCLLAKCAGTSGRVYAFDANPAACEKTSQNAKLNGLNNVEVIRAAFGNHHGSTAHHQNKMSLEGAPQSTNDAASGSWPRLADFISQRKIQKVRVLKIDTEEAEEIVLQGLGANLAAQSIDFILVRLGLSSTSTESLASLLSNAGYLAWEYGTQSPNAWSRTDRVTSRSDCHYLFCSPSCADSVPAISMAGAVTAARSQQPVSQPPVSEDQHKVSKPQFSLAQALWNQREKLALMRPRIQELFTIIDNPGELSLYQWCQFTATVLEFRPDLVMNLGGGGSSIACFLESANQFEKEQCRVVNICPDPAWQQVTSQRLKSIVPADWFDAGSVMQQDILTFDFQAALGDSKRCLVFWDSTGFDAAECILGRLLPLLQSRQHMILMHDLSDLRYCSPDPSYTVGGLWKGEHTEGALWLGWIFSRVAQSISILDFTTRNNVALYSADESLHEELVNDPEKVVALGTMLGTEMASLQCHWFWFTLNGVQQKLTFPIFSPTSSPRASSPQDPPNKLEQGIDSEAIVNSLGWRILLRWRKLTNSLAPMGSRRRKMYNRFLRWMSRRVS